MVQVVRVCELDGVEAAAGKVDCALAEVVPPDLH